MTLPAGNNNKPLSLAEVRERQRQRKLLRTNTFASVSQHITATTTVPLITPQQQRQVVSARATAAVINESTALPFRSVKTTDLPSQQHRSNWDLLGKATAVQAADSSEQDYSSANSSSEDETAVRVVDGVECFAAASDSDGSMDVDGFSSSGNRHTAVYQTAVFDDDKMDEDEILPVDSLKPAPQLSQSAACNTLRRLMEPKQKEISRDIFAFNRPKKTQQNDRGQQSESRSTEKPAQHLDFETFSAPVEWNLRTEIAVTSTQSFSWLADPTFEDHASCLPLSECATQRGQTDESNIRQLLRQLHYWHYAASSAASGSVLVDSNSTETNLAEEWHATFQSIFYSWFIVGSGCPYFYYLHPSLNVLFMPKRQNGRREIRISPCSGYLLNLLIAANFTITTPVESTVESSGDCNTMIWKAQWNADYETVKPTNKPFPLKPPEGTLLIGSDGSEEESEESLMLFYDFLVNNRQKLCAMNSGSAGKVFPEFLAPTPFANSQLKLNRMTRPTSITKSNPYTGQLEVLNQFRIRGPILPTRLTFILQSLATFSSGDAVFECALTPSNFSGFGVENNESEEQSSYRRQLRTIEFDQTKYICRF